MQFKLDHDYGWDDGLICGGTLDLAVAPLPGDEEFAHLLDDVDQRRDTRLRLRVTTDDGPVEYHLHLPPRERPRGCPASRSGIGASRIQSSRRH